ncbi:ComE operon protein 1 [Nymphon striatum]|nr:ComE operon protein 1 [Nymphon striatum]
MGLIFSSTIRKVLMSFVFSLMLIPALASASTEYKGTETVNINKANASTLAAYLKGVGPSKAEAIVKYRKANGRFSKVEDLKNVPGIGEETYKDVKKNVSTSRGKSVAPEGYKMGKASPSSKKSSSSKKKATKKSTSSKSSASSSKKTSSKIADVEKKSSAKKTSSKKTSAKKKTSDSKASKKKASTKKTTSKKKTTTKKKKPTKKKEKK